MIQIFFRQHGKTNFVRVADSTHERLRIYLWKKGYATQKFVDQVRTAHGAVSEELIVRHLDSVTQDHVYIYRYLRADHQEIDMGPYATHSEAEQERAEHASFGALTSGPFEMPPSYQLYKGSPED